MKTKEFIRAAVALPDAMHVSLLSSPIVQSLQPTAPAPSTGVVVQGTGESDFIHKAGDNDVIVNSSFFNYTHETKGLTEFDDVVHGGDQRDYIFSHGGNDKIYGDDGGDLLGGMEGSDLIDGGSGFDTATYETDTAGVRVDLVAQTVIETDGVDTLVSIEKVIGSDHADSFRGSSGDDVFVGNKGADSIHGGSGKDDLSTFGEGGVIHGDGGDDQIHGAAYTAIHGGNGSDQIWGVGGSTIHGDAGNDTIHAMGKAFGDTGNDIIVDDNGGATDAFVGGAGDDQLGIQLGQVSHNATVLLDGGKGDDLLSLSNVDGISLNATVDGGDGNDTLAINGQSQVTADLAAGDDQVHLLSAQDVSLTLGEGRDTFYFLLFEPRTSHITVTDFAPGDTGDIVDGHDFDFWKDLFKGWDHSNPFAEGFLRLRQSGTGTLLQYDIDGSKPKSGWATLLTLEQTQKSAFSAANFDGYDPNGALVSIAGEIFKGNSRGNSHHGTIGDDIAYGRDGDDYLYGDDGNDALVGGNGNDFLAGEYGDDLIQPGPGTDDVRGGAGVDTITYESANGGVTVDLSNTRRQATGADQGYDWIHNSSDDGAVSKVENLIGSKFNDTLAGADDANVLTGLDGADIINGRGGNDILIGGSGADELTGGTGNDRFVFAAASESTSVGFDRIKDFDAAVDRIDTPKAVKTLDPAISTGALSTSSFDGDLATAAANLHARHAVLFTPDTGDLSGHTFLIVDGDGVTGYQAGGDFVIDITGAANLANLSAANFV